MLAIRSGATLLTLFKAPSAAATVGYLAAGLTLPFFAAYKEKCYPQKATLNAGNIPKGELSMPDLVPMGVIVACNPPSHDQSFMSRVEGKHRLEIE